jgi:glucose/arabinose dehydrogenase
MTMRTFAAAIACLTAATLVLLASEGPRAESAARRKSGYALSGDMCGPFPKVRIGMRSGYCVGLVAGKEDGLKFPRSIVQIPGTRFFVVADMVNWGETGRLWLLDPQAAEGKRLKEVINGLDYPHGLAIGIDRRVYASTVDKIFRFDPLAANPNATKEVIVQGLPGKDVKPANGKKLIYNHPLKHFVFDKTGRLYVNIGAPTDACDPGPSESKTCAEGEGVSPLAAKWALPLAAIWAFTPPTGGIFPALKDTAAGPKQHEVYARGLRNSMALAMHPQFPDPGFAFLQGENARDLPDANKPNEEINALERGKHYGWPYCYDLATVSPEYAGFLKADTRYRDLCTNTALYKSPHSLMPPHGAPLAMFYYQGEKFSELKGKLIVGLHGYRPTGSRVLAYEVDAHGFPKVSPPPVHYGVNCGPEPTQVYATDSGTQVAAAQGTELISGWYSVKGVRPRGAPVGMTVASDGAIWLVEDKNKTILRIDAEPASDSGKPLACATRSPDQIAALASMVAKNPANQKRLRQVRTDLAQQHCYKCHSDFGVEASMTDGQKDDAVLRYILTQDGWVFPGDSSAGRLHTRVWGKGSEKIMPSDNGPELLKDANYRQLLTTLDQFIDMMVPGTRKRVAGGRSGAVNLSSRTKKSCGAIPDKTVVVVLDANPKEKPGFSRIYRPADQYFEAECEDQDGYYVSSTSLRNL